MNNLYCWAMSGYLPDGEFKLKNVDKFEIQLAKRVQ